MQSLREECESLHTALRDIAQAVLQDADGTVDGEERDVDETRDMTSDLTLPSPYAKSTPMRYGICDRCQI